MIVVVTDTCIFIDLWNIRLMHEFFALDLMVHTTFDVVSELEQAQKDVLKTHNQAGKLTIHNLTHEQRIMIGQTPYPRALSEPDKSVMHLAISLNAMVLSSDKVLRNCAKAKNLDYHGILWIIEQLVTHNHITPQDGILKLELLLNTNNMMQGSKEVMNKISQCKEIWASN